MELVILKHYFIDKYWFYLKWAENVNPVVPRTKRKTYKWLPLWMSKVLITIIKLLVGGGYSHVSHSNLHFT